MPRQSRRSAPVRQQRQASTVPVRQAPPPAPVPQQQQRAVGQPTQGQQQPGLFGQMASTAAGVAVGSTIGHTLGAGLTGLFGGGNSQPAESSQPQGYTPAQDYQPQNYPESTYTQTTFEQTSACEADAKAFVKCLEQNGNNVNACAWYLEALKQCQAMAKQY